VSADPRITLARPDLADAALEGRVRAGRFSAPRPRRCARPTAALRKAADANAEQLDELLFGEIFDVLDESDGWAWGQARRDGYVGHVLASDLDADLSPPTHWQRALRTPVFSRPDMRSPVLGFHSMNSLVRIDGADGRFVRAAGSGWVFEQHLAPLGEVEGDWVAAAERYFGAPYLWGGRGSLGIDCSGLVQQALYACGQGCPRDSDQQREVGGAVEEADLGRGDLVFWSGHVAMMVDEARIIHANGHHMAVEVEPLAAAIERIERAGVGKPLGYRRP
jgi:hypothetical protein